MSHPPGPGMYFPTERPYQNLVSTQGDRNVASMAMGWTAGFGWFVLVHAFLESRRVRKFNMYTFLIWGEFAANIYMAVQTYLFLQEVIKPSFWYFFFLVFSWCIQTQFLMQIIVNRLCILLGSNRQRTMLRWGVAAAITPINISVYCVWMPAQLQISERFIVANMWWDRVEKVLFLFFDAGLNWYFIRTVKRRLVEYGGLKKYHRIVRYNTQIIWVSIGMDALIIAMMSLANPLVYVQFHPVAYLVKLNIEMALSKLIIRVARETGVTVDEGTTDDEKSRSLGMSGLGGRRSGPGVGGNSGMQVSVQVTRTIRRGEDIELEEQSAGLEDMWPASAKPEGAQTDRSSSVDLSTQKDKVFFQVV